MISNGSVGEDGRLPPERSPAGTLGVGRRSLRCDLDRLARLAEETRLARNASVYEKVNAAFHRRIAEAARNELFLTLLDAVNDIPSCERLGESAPCFKRQAFHGDFHAEIVEAISARDGTRAGRAMHDHLQYVQENILRRAFPAPALADAVNV